MSDDENPRERDGQVNEHKWPDVPRLAFGAVGDAFDAHIGWVQSRPRDMAGYIEGYRKAASAVFEAAAERRHSLEYIVFPLTFLWRHHIELALKNIIAVGRELAEAEWSFPSGHNLMALWKEALPHIVACGSKNSPELPVVEANLREFQAIDPAADGFRYPLSHDRKSRSMPNAPEHVNLRQLQEAMEALGNFFEGVRMEQSIRLDYVRECNAEMQKQYEFDTRDGDDR